MSYSLILVLHGIIGVINFLFKQCILYYKTRFQFLKDCRRISEGFEITQSLLGMSVELVKHFQMQICYISRGLLSIVHTSSSLCKLFSLWKLVCKALLAGAMHRDPRLSCR